MTASNPMAPSRIASMTAAATIPIGIASISRRTWMNFPLAAITHAGLKEMAQMLERLD